VQQGMVLAVEVLVDLEKENVLLIPIQLLL